MRLANEKGFSLLELMVAIAISSLMMYAIFVVMRTSNEQMQAADVKMAIQDSAREGIYKMIQEIRLSAPNELSVENGGTLLRFNIPDSTTPLEADYTVDWTTADEIVYQLGGTSNTQIIRTINGANAKVIANDVTSLVFTGDATPPNVVTVTVNLQKQMTNTRQMTATPLQIIANAELRNA